MNKEAEQIRSLSLAHRDQELAECVEMMIAPDWMDVATTAAAYSRVIETEPDKVSQFLGKVIRIGMSAVAESMIARHQAAQEGLPNEPREPEWLERRTTASRDGRAVRSGTGHR